MIPGGNAGVGEYGSYAVRILQYHLAELLTLEYAAVDRVVRIALDIGSLPSFRCTLMPQRQAHM